MDSQIINLNVGGVYYTTTSKTLMADKDSIFVDMLSLTPRKDFEIYNIKKDEKGVYIIDRDGKLFRYILNWLRDGTIVQDMINKNDLQQLKRECTFYGLEDFIKDLNKISPITRCEFISILNNSKGRKIDFSGFILNNIDISNVYIKNACMENASLEGVNLSNSIITYGKFNDTNLRHSKINNAQIVNTDLFKSDMQFSRFEKTKIGNVDMNDTKCNYSYFSSAIFKEVQMEETDFSNCIGVNSSFLNVKLSHCNFTNSDLSNSKSR